MIINTRRKTVSECALNCAQSDIEIFLEFSLKILYWWSKDRKSIFLEKTVVMLATRCILFNTPGVGFRSRLFQDSSIKLAIKVHQSYSLRVQ